MKICKDKDGYFILDNANQVVWLNYNNILTNRMPTIMHLGLSFWDHNEKGNIFTDEHEVLVENIPRFKAIKYKVLEYLIKKNQNKRDRYN